MRTGVTVFFVLALLAPQPGWAQDDQDSQYALGETTDDEAGEAADAPNETDASFTDLDTNDDLKNDDEAAPASEIQDSPSPVAEANPPTHAPSTAAVSATLIEQLGHENAPGKHPAIVPLVSVDPALAPSRVAELEHLLRLALLGRDQVDVVDLRLVLEPSSGQDALRLIDKAVNDYNAGRQAYENLEAGQATELLNASCTAFELGYAALGDPEKMVMAHIYLASVYLQNGQAEASGPHYRSALFLKPSLALDSNIFSPEDIQALEEQRRLISQESKGGVEVRSSPVAARVYVDGLFRGSTPLELNDLAPGRHFLTLERDGFERVADIVEVNTDQQANLERSLIPLRGYARLHQLLALIDPEVVDLGGMITPLRSLFANDQALILTGQQQADGQLMARVHLVDFKSGLRLRSAQGLLPANSLQATPALRSLVDQALDLSAGVEQAPSEPMVDLSGLEDVQIPWTPILAGTGGVIAVGALAAGTYWLVDTQMQPSNTGLHGGERVVVLGF